VPDGLAAGGGAPRQTPHIRNRAREFRVNHRVAKRHTARVLRKKARIRPGT